MNADLDRVMDRIKKCLALANSSEPHEAAAAMRQAQKLMDKYNLDHADLGQSEIGELKIRSRVSVSRFKRWELMFMRMLAKSYGCRILWNPSSSYARGSSVFGSWSMIGLKPQLKLAEYTAEVMLRRLVSQRADFVRNLPAAMDRDSKAAEGDGFATGWVQAVSATVAEFARADEIKPQLDSYMETHHGKLKDAKMRNGYVGQSGLAAGEAAGSRESLNRPVSGFTMRQLA